MCWPKITFSALGACLVILGIFTVIFSIIEGIITNPTSVYMISDVYWQVATVIGFLDMSLGLGILMFDRLNERLKNLENKKE